jgi:hypothetical protein
MSNWPGVRNSAAPVFFSQDGRNAGRREQTRPARVFAKSADGNHHSFSVCKGQLRTRIVKDSVRTDGMDRIGGPASKHFGPMIPFRTRTATET